MSKSITPIYVDLKDYNNTSSDKDTVSDIKDSIVIGDIIDLLLEFTSLPQHKQRHAVKEVAQRIEQISKENAIRYASMAIRSAIAQIAYSDGKPQTIAVIQKLGLFDDNVIGHLANEFGVSRQMIHQHSNSIKAVSDFNRIKMKLRKQRKTSKRKSKFKSKSFNQTIIKF